MQYNSSKTIQSKVNPGVAFTLKRMNKRRRDAVHDLHAVFLAELKPLQDEFRPLEDEFDAARKAARLVHKAERAEAIAGGMPEAEALRQFPYGEMAFANEKFARWAALTEQISNIDRRSVTPATIRWALVKIEGLEIDGEPATFDSLADSGPDDLYDEIALAVMREMGLLPEEKENLRLPSTSPAAVDGKATHGSAGVVEMPATITPSEAAGSSTVQASANVRSISGQQ